MKSDRERINFSSLQFSQKKIVDRRAIATINQSTMQPSQGRTWSDRHRHRLYMSVSVDRAPFRARLSLSIWPICQTVWSRSSCWFVYNLTYHNSCLVGTFSAPRSEIIDIVVCEDRYDHRSHYVNRTSSAAAFVEVEKIDRLNDAVVLGPGWELVRGCPRIERVTSFPLLLLANELI